MKDLGLALCLFVPVAGCSTDDPSSSSVSDVALASVDTVAGEVQGGADTVAPGGEGTGSADSVLADTSMALDALGDGVGVGTPGQADAGAISPCAYPLVVLQTGKDTECSGGNDLNGPWGWPRATVTAGALWTPRGAVMTT